MQKAVEISQYELERGKPIPSQLHSRVQSKLMIVLGGQYQNQYDFLSELSLELSDWESVPDIAIYPKMEFDHAQNEIKMTTAPLGAIEILSSPQSLPELVSEARKYFDGGVKSCWLVLPTLKNIYVFSAPETYQIFKAGETLSDPVLGLSLELAQVFR
ncbi:MAG: Uma2 family endonuclease [Meiothermus sp.]